MAEKELKYRFIDAIELSYFEFGRNEKRFVLYALTQSYEYERVNTLRCSVTLQDGFHFLCDDKESLDELSDKLDGLFKAFAVKIETKTRITRLNLLKEITVGSKNVTLSFHSGYLNRWLNFVEEENEINELLKEVDEVL